LLLQKYYVVYVRVPSGYPGVMTIEVPLNEGNHLREAMWNTYGYAILDILEAK